MDYLPLHFDLKSRHCLLVGGGEIALRKAELLESAGAIVTVVAPSINADIRRLLGAAPHRLLERAWESADLDGKALIVCATDDADVNARVSSEAQARQLPVNVVDHPDLCTVIFPSIIDRSPVIASVATGGHSPVLTRFLREMLEALIGEGYGRLARYLGERREGLKARFIETVPRRRHTEKFLLSAGAEHAMRGEFEAADKYLEAESPRLEVGEVYLVGAGPGDPDLLTLRALQLMQKADIVLYDNLVSDAVLGRVRRDARMQNVGKTAGDDSMQQETINDMLVRLASEGQRVLRLKGGDPFIFGRGGEEIETLAAHGIPFQVVPGITAANGCAAYAGIPLTHRDYSQSVRFVTGHPRDGEVRLEWSEFAHENQTIVFYMGLGGLERICENLVAHGRDAATPVAIVSRGTTPEQQVVVGTLDTIAGLARAREIRRPTLIIVGEVVRLYDTLNPGRVPGPD
jgi:uroporphyrin-III C-methyltransferase/precorrin-2 dehydrogenase/sirohydrochlorin ferrochelatase